MSRSKRKGKFDKYIDHLEEMIEIGGGCPFGRKDFMYDS